MLVLTVGDGQAMVVALAVNDVMTGPEAGAWVGGGAADVATRAGVVVGWPLVVVAAAVVVTDRDVVVAFFADASDDPSSPPHAAITVALASTATRPSVNFRRVDDGRPCCSNRIAGPLSPVARPTATSARSGRPGQRASCAASGSDGRDHDIVRYPNHVAIEEHGAKR